MDYLYDELPPHQRRQAEDHLDTCPQCRARMAGWKQTVQALDSDRGSQMRTVHRHPRVNTRAIQQWAAVLIVTLSLGFAAGRRGSVSTSEVQRAIASAQEAWQRQSEQRHRQETEKATAEISARLIEENHLFFADFARQWGAAHANEQVVLAHQLQSFEDQRALDYGELRRDLDILARQTGTGFRQAESQLNLLAGGLALTPSSFPGDTNTVSGTLR